MSGPIRNLDAPCMVCERPAGDHTLREWSVCMGTTTTDLPYEELPADSRALAERFGLPDDTLLVDNVVAKAVAMQAGVGPGQHVVMPMVLHEFSRSPHVGEVLARVAYVGDVHSVRQYGRLLRDTANGAANAAERSAA